MKRFNMIAQYGYKVTPEIAEDGGWVRYEAHEAEVKRLWDMLLEQEEELQDQAQVIKAALETIETYRLLGTDDANVQDQREGK